MGNILGAYHYASSLNMNFFLFIITVLFALFQKVEDSVPSYTHVEEGTETRDEQGKLVKADTSDVVKFKYTRSARHYLGDLVRKNNVDAQLTTAAYHKDTKILVTGLSQFCFISSGSRIFGGRII